MIPAQVHSPLITYVSKIALRKQIKMFLLGDPKSSERIARTGYVVTLQIGETFAGKIALL